MNIQDDVCHWFLTCVHDVQVIVLSIKKKEINLQLAKRDLLLFFFFLIVT